MTGLGVNPWAVLGAAIVTLGIGALWYSPVLFGRAWATANGYTRAKLESMKLNLGRIYLTSFSGYLVMAAVLSILMERMGMATPAGGIGIGMLCWLGFAATLGLIGNMFSDRPLRAYIVDGGFQLVYLSVMGLLIGMWR